MSQNENKFNFKTVNMNNTFISNSYSSRSSKFDYIKNFLPGRGDILSSLSAPHVLWGITKIFNSVKLRTSKAYSYAYYIYYSYLLYQN